MLSIENGLAPFTSSTMWDTSERLTGSQLADDVYTDSNIQAFSGARATVEMLAADQRYKYASDDGQYGIAARTYIDNIGTGVDLGFYYANYHSKVPYIQMVGKGGVLSGDHVGAYIAQYGNWLLHYGAGPYDLTSIGFNQGGDNSSFSVANLVF